MKQVSLLMQDVQKEASAILNKLDAICKKIGTKYCLAYGTLIGAIRHKGFIPWDDDIDIMMPRKDYDKLISFFIENDNNIEGLSVFSPETNKDYPYMIARVCSDKYIIETDNEKSCGMGIFIDIYPLDGMGNDLEIAKKKKRKINRSIALCFISTRLKFKRGNTKSTLKMWLKFPAFIFAHLMGKEFFFKQIQKQSKYADYDNSKYIGCLVWGSDEGDRGVYLKEWFEKMIDWEFEEYIFKIPVGYDKLLKQTYGEYMKLPPEEERVAHHFYSAYLRE